MREANSSKVGLQQKVAGEQSASGYACVCVWSLQLWCSGVKVVTSALPHPPLPPSPPPSPPPFLPPGPTELSSQLQSNDEELTVARKEVQVAQGEVAG